MKRNNQILLTLLILVSFSLSGCELIAGIFKAGVWVGILIVVVVVAIIIWLINKARK